MRNQPHFWPPNQPYPNPGDLPCPAGLRHVLVEPCTTDTYKFLHDAAIVAHKGVLVAGWYNCPEREIEGESLIRARRSADGGKTWSGLEVVASDRQREGVFYVPVQFLSHQGILHAFVGKMKGGHDRIVACATYSLDETRNEWVSRGEIADLFLPNTAPMKMANGNFIMGGRVAAALGELPLIPAVAISAGEALTGRWRVVPLCAQEFPAGHHPETALLMRDGELVALVRNNGSLTPRLFRSQDHGETWNELLGHQFTATAAKMYSGTLGTGQRYVLFNHPRDGRRFLILGVSRPGGMAPVRLWRIQGPASGEPGVSHYPCAVEHDGLLHIVYTAHYSGQRTCELATVPVRALAIEELCDDFLAEPFHRFRDAEHARVRACLDRIKPLVNEVIRQG